MCKISNHPSRSTKSRNSLRVYTYLASVADMKIRWNSTYAMLLRFKRLSKSIKKAALDNQNVAKITNFLDDNSDHFLNCLLNLLKPFLDATLSLSHEKCTLLTADLILADLMSKIHPDLKKSFYQRILTRRNRGHLVLFWARRFWNCFTLL